MSQAQLEVERIRQYPCQIQAVRIKVKVQVPGKHFSQLTAAEQRLLFEGTAAEFAERHKFAQHHKGWGSAHTGPGIRFLCEPDAIDDPDCKGFWTTVSLWNRWRHETYKAGRAKVCGRPAPRPQQPSPRPRPRRTRERRCIDDMAHHRVIREAVRETVRSAGVARHVLVFVVRSVCTLYTGCGRGCLYLHWE